MDSGGYHINNVNGDLTINRKEKNNSYLNISYFSKHNYNILLVIYSKNILMKLKYKTIFKDPVY